LNDDDAHGMKEWNRYSMGSSRKLRILERRDGSKQVMALTRRKPATPVTVQYRLLLPIAKQTLIYSNFQSLYDDNLHTISKPAEELTLSIAVFNNPPCNPASLLADEM
jgi:hypothetical protein